MLADSANIIPQSGQLDRDILLPDTAKLELVGFIAEELPRWRDHPDRPAAAAETRLTEYLCGYLNSAVHNSSTWDHIQFQAETIDETRGERKIDLSVKPRAAALIIEGRRHSQFESLFPIECKRLPTPIKNGRDKREYVTNEPGTTGGIQRFKFGFHASKHSFAAIIAYVQDQSFSYWTDQVNDWIRELADDISSKWNCSDLLQLVDENTEVRMLHSEHQREGCLGKIELRHLWISIN